MRQVIGLVLLGLCSINALPAGDNDGTPTEGVSQSGRIINGVGAKIENHKYAIFLRFDTTICTAVIITASHALTAAHCVISIEDNPSKITLYGGSTSHKTGGVSIQVEKVAVHPSYKKPKHGAGEFDVAVLTVAKNAFKGKQNIARIALQTSELPVGTRCFVVGWGRTDINVKGASKELRYAHMNIVSLDTCIEAWTPHRQKVTSNMICAQYKDGVDTCRGDSGGPFVCGGKLSGITSFSHPNCTGAWPAGFTNIVAPSIRSFIENQTKM